MQAVAIVLADAAGTPVNHTFNPSGKDPKGVFWFYDRSQTNAIGYWKISIQLVEPPPARAGQSSADRAYRAKVTLHEPVLETISNSTVSGITPAPTVAYIPRVSTEYIMSERSVLLERQHLRKMNYNLQNNAQVVSIVETLEQLYG